MYILYYDAQCPLCTKFANALRKKLPGSRISFQAAKADASEFKLRTSKGNIFYGDSALNILLKEFPSIKSYFSLLPTGMQGSAVRVTVRAARIARYAVKKVTPKRGCGCHKRR